MPSVAVKTADFSDYSALLTSILGTSITEKDFYTIGERIFNLERHMNCREGINRQSDTLPVRILKETREDNWPSIELDQMLNHYYKLRGWTQIGKPEGKTLKRLNILPN